MPKREPDDSHTRETARVRGLGWRPDPPDPRDFKARALLGARRGLPGEAMELEGCVPGIKDQLFTSSCVGQAVSTAVDARLRKLGRWSAPPTSAQAVYAVARILARLGKEDPLADEGSYPRLAMQGLKEWGAPPAASWPFDPATINDDPPLDVLMAASAARVSAWWRIGSEGRERVEDVCQAIAAGYPVAFGTDVDGRFMDHVGKDPIGAHDPSDVRGGHMMCLVGYTTRSSQRVLRGVNSWGLSWGDSGMFWAAEEFVTDPAFGDAYVIQVAGA